MPELLPAERDFLRQLSVIIEQNMAREQFGVTELAGAMSMSRSNLLRKVKKVTNLSVSQLISQARLKHAMELLRSTSLNVSEVAHQAGFNSTSYFIKCFREYYGYPPGEAGKRAAVEASDPPAGDPQRLPAGIKITRHWRWAAPLLAIALVSAIYYTWPWSPPPLEKSIVVLPFKNDSSDSTNLYLINGLMESTLNNLQKIQDVKVISRTSAEKYRHNARSIPEMARELQVNYFVEGSGQKIGNQILLNIQLIEGPTDRHLWSKQYRREARDIFALQQEVAKNIAAEIEAVITPEEQQRIEKIPTGNLEAYDHFLKGRDLFFNGNGRKLPEALGEFNKAIALDPEFALAYAETALVYYYLDVFQIEKKYGAELNNYADKALLYDPKLDESLVAKALSYVYKKEYASAIPYFEKALEYKPNSGMVINFLSEFYFMHVPNTAKYLEYSLRGIQVDIGAYDSATTSHRYLHAANAFVQAGFIDEASAYIDKSLAYNPTNPYAGFLRVYIRHAKNFDLSEIKAQLIRELQKDTTQFIITQEIAKVCYYMRDYPEAYRYYRRFMAFREARQLNLFEVENLKIAEVLAHMGYKEEAATNLASFKHYADNDRTIYKHLSLSAYYGYHKDTRKALEHLRLFSRENNYQYWVLLCPNEPTLDPIKDLPEFKAIMKDIETKFWQTHRTIREDLENKGLL